MGLTSPTAWRSGGGRRTWRWLLAIGGVAAALLVALVVVRAAARRRPVAGGPSPLAVVIAVLAGAAVIVTWLESRRITRHLNRTIERLIDTESELRLLLDDLPEAVLSLDDDGVVRGANAKAAELTGRPRERADRPARSPTLVEPARGDRPRRLAGQRTLRARPPSR